MSCSIGGPLPRHHNGDMVPANPGSPPNSTRIGLPSCAPYSGPRYDHEVRVVNGEAARTRTHRRRGCKFARPHFCGTFGLWGPTGKNGPAAEGAHCDGYGGTTTVGARQDPTDATGQCSAAAIRRSCDWRSRLTKYALYPVTLTTSPRYCSGSCCALRSVSALTRLICRCWPPRLK